MSKEELPQNSLFNISAQVFNIQTRKEETLNQYNCFYQSSLDALCLVFEQTAHFSSLSRDAMMNMMDLAKKLKIKSIVLLIDRKSKEYAKLIQGMMVFGFAFDKNKKMATIDNQSYKILSMELQEQSGLIEEVAF